MPAGDGAAALTPAERAVVALALADLSNRDIAARRGSAPRTVANQLAAAYAKLGISSRAELASWVANGGRGP
jgi:DNA-binding CsgD family transcriptional regulator